MLIRFSVENFMSYRDSQVFSMVAGKHTKHGDHLIELKGKRILKGSFFFGANASGKSNLFEAISFARKVIMSDLKQTSLLNKHFRIESDYAEKPGIFQFDIYANGHFYSYGFAISYLRACVEEEWLYLCDTSEKTIFERSIDNGKRSIKTEVNFSNDEQRQSFKVFSENVADDKLFLTEIAERKLIENEDFFAYADVRNWFRNLCMVSPGSRYLNKLRMLSNDDTNNDLERLLYAFDTGIEGISLDERSMEEVLNFLPDEARKEIMQDVEKAFNETDTGGDEPKEVNINMANRSLQFRKKGSEIVGAQLAMNHGNRADLFTLSDESDGTRRLFDLIPLFRRGENPCVIIVDELDRSFHTKLVTKFIQLYYEKTYGVESQLIATVHDSNVMDLELLRQDEIWFVERETDHSSKIYSLNRFQTRFDKKVSKDYLLGRYGAIPCFSQFGIANEESE